MAKNNLSSYTSADGLGFPLNFRRGNPNPLDNSSVWASLEAAQTYATSDPTAYVGQLLSVVDAENDEVTVYSIQDEAGTLLEVGKATAGDNNSIVLSEDGILSLKGIADATEGQQIRRKADGSIEWFTPDNSTVSGLQSTVGGLQTTIGTATEGETAGTGLTKRIEDLESGKADAATTLEGYGITDAYTKTETDTAISTAVGNVVNSAPEAFDTLKEIADWINSDETGAASLANRIGALETTVDTATTGLSDRMTAAEGDIDDLEALTAGELKVGETTYTTLKGYIDAADAVIDAKITGISDDLGDLAALDEVAESNLNSDLADKINGKADKVASATDGNFAGLDADGNLTDSGKKAADFEAADATILKQANVVDNLTSSSAIAPLSANQGRALDVAKADKVASATNGNFAGLDSNGNLTDSGKKAADFATADHDHDTAYSAIDHDHDDEYDALGAAAAAKTAVLGKVGGTGADKDDDYNGTVKGAYEAAAAAQSTADSAIKGVQVNGSALTPDASKVVNVTVAEGTANGTVAVNGTDVSVHGLDSAAYQPTTAFDAAGTAEAKVNAIMGKIGEDQFTETTATVADIYTTANAALPKAGGTMTGALTLAADPANNMEAATKNYVDGKFNPLSTAIGTAKDGETAGTGLTGRMEVAESEIDALQALSAGTLKIGETTYTTLKAYSDAKDQAISDYVGTFTAVNGETTVVGYVDAKVAAQATAGTVAVTEAETADTGYIKTYNITQGSTNVGKINIPKDFLVKSATVKTCETADTPVAGLAVGDKYIDFVINSKDASATDEHVYLNVKDLVDVYTAEQSAAQVQVAVSDANVISATIVAGSVGTTELSTDVNTALGKAHTHENATVLDGITAEDVEAWDGAVDDQHTHENATVLDGITAEDVEAWDGAATDSHTHENATVLAGITEAKVTAWDNVTGAVNTVTSDTLKVTAGTNTVAVDLEWGTF